MKIIGCALHTRYQQIAMLDQETGELIERRLEHGSGGARAFYAGLAAPVRLGVEASGYTRWFERMLGELGHELWDKSHIKLLWGIRRELRRRTDYRSKTSRHQ